MKLLIVMPEDFTAGGPISNRLNMLASGMKDQKNDIRMLGLSYKDTGDYIEKRINGSTYGYQIGVKNEFSKSKKFQLYLFFILPAKFQSALNQIFIDWKPEAVIVYGSSALFTNPLINTCRQWGIKIYNDCTEWFNIRLQRFLSPLLYDQYFFLHLTIKRLNGVFAISRVWENNAIKKGVPVLRVPVLSKFLKTDEKNSQEDSEFSNTFNLTYIGSFVKRDLPEILLKAVKKAVLEKIEIHLTVIGNVSRFSYGKKIVNQIMKDEILKSHITLTGFITDSELEKKVNESSALILLRPDTHEARACLPTRLVDFFRTGKPVILSDVGDISEYCKHKTNAWLISPDKFQIDSLIDAFKNLMTNSQLAKMIGKNGHDLAKSIFDVSMHCQRMVDFINKT